MVTKKIDKHFMFCYKKITKHLKSAYPDSDYAFETLPFLCAVTDYIFHVSGNKKSRIEAFHQIHEKIDDKYLYSTEINEKFDLRMDFYGTIINGVRKPRSEWDIAGIVSLRNPIARCCVAFFDMIYNPECASNYDSEPILLTDVFDMMSTVKDYNLIEGNVLKYWKKFMPVRI